ncbi:MAG: NAD-dependent epimerase/dehydratase family protein, partial [Bradymonadaceae bacterium]
LQLLGYLALLFFLFLLLRQHRLQFLAGTAVGPLDDDALELRKADAVALADVALGQTDTRYVPEDPAIREAGIDESRPLDFRSPYGCSKGAADQYVLDYARQYGLPAVVFRMSCVYGPSQRGCEDQGWIAHFVASTIEGRGLTLFGDGKQVRDTLFVDDLVRAMRRAVDAIDRTAGRAFNIGGGPERTLSLLELLATLETMHGRLPPVEYADWRAADQRYYVSDTSRFQEATGWGPRVEIAEGLERLYDWLRTDTTEQTPRRRPWPSPDPQYS